MKLSSPQVNSRSCILKSLSEKSSILDSLSCNSSLSDNVFRHSFTSLQSVCSYRLLCCFLLASNPLTLTDKGHIYTQVSCISNMYPSCGLWWYFLFKLSSGLFYCQHVSPCWNCLNRFVSWCCAWRCIKKTNLNRINYNFKVFPTSTSERMWTWT